MITWNQIDCDSQQKVLNLIRSLLSPNNDLELDQSILAAILELEMWSNLPNEVDGFYIAQAVEQVDEE